MENCIARRFEIFAATLDKLRKYFVVFIFAVHVLPRKLDDGSWFLFFAVHVLPRITAKIRRRENFPFYGM